MKFSVNKQAVLVAAGILVTAGLTNAGQYYLWDNHTKGITTDYTAQIDALQMTLDDIGPLIDIYRIAEAGEKGKEITQENLVVSQMPESMFSDAYILDPSSVVGKFYKVDLSPMSALTTDVIMEENVKDSNREVDLVFSTRTSGLKVGDYIDLEIIMPNGEKYVVLSKKRIYNVTENTVKAVMDSVERHTYHSALVDYFLEKDKGAMIQLVKYTEPGVQNAALTHYAPSKNVQSVMAVDPNIGETLNVALTESRRDLIDIAIQRIQGEENEDRADAIAGGADELIAKLSNAYEQYLEDLAEAEINGEDPSTVETPTNESETIVDPAYEPTDGEETGGE